MAFKNKTFLYKVFSPTGTLLANWGVDVANDPSFKSIINSGLGELQIKLARLFSSINENDPLRDINFRNEVQLWIWDKETTNNGLMIYDGFISDYSPYLDEGQEYINVTCLGYVDDLQSSDFVDSNGNTAIQYLQTDPSQIIQNVLAYSNTKIKSNGVSIVNTGLEIDYVYNNLTVMDAINKAKDLSLVNWYWYVGADNILYFKQSSLTADHILNIGKNITKIETTKTIKDLKNYVIFIGGFYDPINAVGSAGWSPTEQLYITYFDQPSINLYGKKIHTIIDKTIISKKTADAQCNKYLLENKEPSVRSTIDIIDSNGDDNSGFDIESLKPGDTIQIIDQTVNTNSQSYSFQGPGVFRIQTVQYNFDKATIEIATRPPWVALTIQNQLNSILQSQNQNTPVRPIVNDPTTPPSVTTPSPVSGNLGTVANTNTFALNIYDYGGTTTAGGPENQGNPYEGMMYERINYGGANINDIRVYLRGAWNSIGSGVILSGTSLPSASSYTNQLFRLTTTDTMYFSNGSVWISLN